MIIQDIKTFDNDKKIIVIKNEKGFEFICQTASEITKELIENNLFELANKPIFEKVIISADFKKIDIETAENKIISNYRSSKKNYEKNCSNCRYSYFLNNEKCLKKKRFDELLKNADKNLIELKWKERYLLEKEATECINNGKDCEEYDCKYITYPLEIQNIDNMQRLLKDKNLKPELVKIRPCNKKYNNKTFLGILIDYDFPINSSFLYSKESKTLTLIMEGNPGIYVPELNEIMFGYESFWQKINNIEEISDITDETIDDLWYIKLLKEL